MRTWEVNTKKTIKKHLRHEYVQNSDYIAVTQYGSHDYSYYGDGVDSAICHCSERSVLQSPLL